VATPPAAAAAARLGDSPEIGVPAAPGAKASRLQAREHHRGTGKQSGATAGPRGARASRATVRGGGHRRRAAFQGLRPAKDYGVRHKRTRERRGDSPRARDGRSCRGRWSPTMAVRRRRGGAHGQTAAEGLGVPWSRGSVGEVPAEVIRGLGQPGIGRRRGNWGSGIAHRRWFFAESR
jgi:hypothetical protein